MKNFIFISPNFPENYWEFCVELKNDGLNVLGIGDAPYGELKSELKNLSEYKFNVDKNTCKNNNANYILESNNTKYPLVHNKIKIVDSMNNTHTVKLHVEKWIPLKAEMCFILIGIGVIFAISAYGWENMYYRGPFSIRKYEQ